jgi:putative oxidoreductase
MSSYPSASGASTAHGALQSGTLSTEFLLLVGRILLGAIFVLSGWGKLMGLSAFAASLEKNGVPAPQVLAVVGAVVEFGGGLAIVLGLWTQLAALLMVAFVVVATLIAHRFWAFEGAARTMQQTNFLKNAAIIGGFLVVAAAGGGRISLDGLMRGRLG